MLLIQSPLRTGAAEMPGSTASPSYAKVGAATCSAGARLNGGLCTDWWQAVAPEQEPVNDRRLQRRIRITDNITEADMRKWWTTVQLTNLKIDEWWTAMTIALAERCPGLTNVSLTNCTRLTDEALIELAGRCPALTDVDVSYCWNLSDAAIIGLAERCPALTNVNVTFCRSLTDAALIRLADCCPALVNITRHQHNRVATLSNRHGWHRGQLQCGRIYWARLGADGKSEISFSEPAYPLY